MFKKFILTTIFILLASINYLIADEDLIIVQCKSDIPDLQFLRPIFEIDIKNKKAKAGDAEYFVVEATSSRIVLHKINPVFSTFIYLNRITGAYKEEQTIFSTKKDEGDKKMINTGVCIKKEKAF
jgi:hypothetical protein